MPLEQAIGISLGLADLQRVGELPLGRLVNSGGLTPRHHLVEGPTEIRKLVVSARPDPRVELAGRDPHGEPRILLRPDDDRTDQPQCRAHPGEQPERHDRPEHREAVRVGSFGLPFRLLRLLNLLGLQLLGQDPERGAQPRHGRRDRSIVVARALGGSEERARVRQGDELTPIGQEASGHDAARRRLGAGEDPHVVQAVGDLREHVLAQPRVEADERGVIGPRRGAGTAPRPPRGQPRATRSLACWRGCPRRRHRVAPSSPHAPAFHPGNGEQRRDDQRQQRENFHAMGTRIEVGVRRLVSMVARSSGSARAW